MPKTKVKSPSDDIAEFYLSLAKPFMSESILMSFRHVVNELVVNEKIKAGDVVVLSESPWLKIKNSTNLFMIALAFQVYGRYTAYQMVLEGKKITARKPTAIYKERKKGLLIEQRLWELVTFSFILRGVESVEALREIGGKITYDIGYLHGIHHMDEFGVQNMVWSVENPSHHAHMTKARDSKPTSRQREKFNEWAEEQLSSGNNSSNLEAMQNLNGYRSEWKSLSVETQKKWARSAGFKFKAGRPTKK